MNEHLF